MSKYDERHGGPYDRGSADSFYGRPRRPHYFPGASYKAPEVDIDHMTPTQIIEYLAGYDDNEEFGDRKDWG